MTLNTLLFTQDIVSWVSGALKQLTYQIHPRGKKHIQNSVSQPCSVSTGHLLRASEGIP